MRNKIFAKIFLIVWIIGFIAVILLDQNGIVDVRKVPNYLSSLFKEADAEEITKTIESRTKDSDLISQVIEENYDRQWLGRSLYQHYCSTCHGSSGKGNGFNAYNVDPRPSDLTNSGLDKKELFEVISLGTAVKGRSPNCGPWENTLREGHIEALVNFLESMKEVNK